MKRQKLLLLTAAIAILNIIVFFVVTLGDLPLELNVALTGLGIAIAVFGLTLIGFMPLEEETTIRCL